VTLLQHVTCCIWTHIKYNSGVIYSIYLNVMYSILGTLMNNSTHNHSLPKIKYFVRSTQLDDCWIENDASLCPKGLVSIQFNFNHDHSHHVWFQSWLIMSCHICFQSLPVHTTNRTCLWSDQALCSLVCIPIRLIRPCLFSMASIAALFTFICPSFQPCLNSIVSFGPCLNSIDICWMQFNFH
jgi:hypothetical protein